MPAKRVILELGTGNDLHGGDYTKAALRAVLRRFDPANLKQRLDQHPTLASILPGARQSRYWAAYEQLYREVASDAENSFDGLYGREFVRAYEAQVKKLE